MIRNIVFDIGMVLIGFEPFDWLRSMFDEKTADRTPSLQAMTAEVILNQLNQVSKPIKPSF